MGIEWTEDLAVGNPEIDQQHRELFAKIDRMLEACIQNKGKEAVGEVIQFLSDYVVYHFGCEEKLMNRHQYPDFAAHKEQHDQFIQKFSDVKTHFEQDGAASYVVIMTNRMVVSWLNNHIRNVDKLLGEYLRKVS